MPSQRYLNCFLSYPKKVSYEVFEENLTEDIAVNVAGKFQGNRWSVFVEITGHLAEFRS
jgi:hypothetical protein